MCMVQSLCMYPLTIADGSILWDGSHCESRYGNEAPDKLANSTG